MGANHEWEPHAEFVVLLQRLTQGQTGRTEWEELSQTSKGRRMPLEVGAVRCPIGCRFKLRSVAHAKELGQNVESPPSTNAVTPTPLKSPHELHLDQAGCAWLRLELAIRPQLPMRFRNAQTGAEHSASSSSCARHCIRSS